MQTQGETGAAAGQLTVRRDQGRTVVVASGDWTIDTIGNLARQVADVRVEGDAALDLAALRTFDTSGAFLIERLTRDRRLKVVNLQDRHAALLEAVGAAMDGPPEKPRGASPLLVLLDRIGENTVKRLLEARNLVGFLGATVIAVSHALLRPSRLRLPALFSHMERAGLNALPIVGLLAFLIGVVLAYQGADQLSRFGAEIFTVNLVAVGMLREMGILITAIVVAGRSGSAFTAQIGTMQVNEEIDALRTIGLDPLAVLVVPRVLALLIVVPLLTFYADMMGLLGGAVMAVLTLDINFGQFVKQLSTAVKASTFWVGIVKAPLFGFVIGMVGCYEGLQVGRSAESVGLRTTRAVVEGIFLVIVLDAAFSVLFSVLGV